MRGYNPFFKTGLRRTLDGLDYRRRFWEDDEETTTQVVTPQPVQLPEYPEASTARKELGGKLTEWGKQPNYGLIEPNWQNIYSQAKKRIGEYYWGSAMQPGIMQKIQASAARRNVSGSPAADIMKGRMGVEEAGQLGQISSDIDLQKAQAGERAREFWAASSGQLSQQKPSFAMGSTTTTTSPGEDLWGQLIGGAASIGGNLWNQNWLAGEKQKDRDFWSGMYGGAQTPASLTGGKSLSEREVGSAFSDALNIGSMIPGPQQPFVIGANLINQFMPWQ